jgi:hypothetical protein
VRRLILASFTALTVLAGGVLAPALGDDGIWERVDKRGIKTGSVTAGIGNLIAVACPASTPKAQPRLVVHIGALQNGFYDGRTTYNLRLVINDYRQDFGMTTSKGSFVFEANDFNQRQQVQDLIDHLIAAAAAGTDQMQLAFSSLGWRGQMPLTGADKVLPGLMDGCDQ